MQDSTRLDPFGFPAQWSVQVRREIRRVSEALATLSSEKRVRLAAGRRAADAAASEDRGAGSTVASGTNRRVVLVLPFPIETGGMRVQVQLARMIRADGTEVHVRQVRGEDCRSRRYDDHGFATRAPVGGPRRLTEALREFAPATLLVGCWIDYFAALEADAGPVIGYSAGEPTLKETGPFDRALNDFAFQVHQLPVTLWSGSKFMCDVYRDRFGRTAKLVSVPMSREMFGRDVAVPVQPPFRVIVAGPEHLTTKGVPGALRALQPLQAEGFHIVWATPRPPSSEFSHLVDEVHVGLGADSLAAVIGSSHCLVYPSRLEGLGLPPLEAMALGVPSVLCPNGGCEEYALPEENCLQVPFDDAERLRAAVLRLRDEPSLAARIRRNGYAAVEPYRPENVHRTIRDFLAERFDMLPFVPVGPAAGHK